LGGGKTPKLQLTIIDAWLKQHFREHLGTKDTVSG
jgi:hypothetical protein